MAAALPMPSHWDACRTNLPAASDPGGRAGPQYGGQPFQDRWREALEAQKEKRLGVGVESNADPPAVSQPWQAVSSRSQILTRLMRRQETTGGAGAQSGAKCNTDLTEQEGDWAFRAVACGADGKNGKADLTGQGGDWAFRAVACGAAGLKVERDSGSLDGSFSGEGGWVGRAMADAAAGVGTGGGEKGGGEQTSGSSAGGKNFPDLVARPGVKDCGKCDGLQERERQRRNSDAAAAEVGCWLKAAASKTGKAVAAELKKGEARVAEDNRHNPSKPLQFCRRGSRLWDLSLGNSTADTPKADGAEVR